MDSSVILRSSALDLAAAIRSRDVTARAVLDAHVARIDAVNGALNAMIADRFAASREEADAIDDAIARGADAGPLAGVPFSVKEMFSLRGMPHTLGCVERRGNRGLRDATLVRRLCAAGAIPLGVTNVPEWGFWFETDNLIHGRTRNPHDLRRTSGGSSGGEGAIVAAGGAPFGLGSDIGGSIRMPAAFCGVVGHKPSHGLLPLTGHYPVYDVGPDAEIDKRSPYLAAGPIARHATDLAPLLRIMAGPDGVDPNARDLAVGDPATVSWRGRRVLVLDRPRIRFAAEADDVMSVAVRVAADRLRELGADVHAVPRDLFIDAVDLWGAALRAGSAKSLAETIALVRWRDIGSAWLHSVGGRPTVTLPLLLFALGDRIGRHRLRDLDSLMRRLDALRTRLHDDLGNGVLLMPPHPRVAPLHNRPMLRPFDFAYTAIFNALRMPATVVPVARDADGLPVGVQIAAADGNDHVSISAAIELERVTGAFAPARVPAARAGPSRRRRSSKSSRASAGK
jgi:fatty acid amide hydrolase 2